VQLYAAPAELAAAAGAYLAEGFAAGLSSLVVATADHAGLFDTELRDQGWDPEKLVASGQLVVLDAETTLASIMDGGEMPSHARFNEVVGGQLDAIELKTTARPVRVFGEMVDVLCARRQQDAAAALEDLWNELGLRRSFALLCGYHVDLFDPSTQAGLLPSVCSAHTHVQASPDHERLHEAVDAALISELGPTLSTKVYALVSRQSREQHIPLAQRALMWVTANMPGTAPRILATARSEYLG
jgi:hypothetical protein